MVSQRAESLGIDPEFRESFDLCISRAVATLPVMLEYCLPLIRLGGELWAWQGESFNASDWEIPLNLLGGKILEVQTYILPEDPSSRKRILVRVQKN